MRSFWRQCEPNSMNSQSEQPNGDWEFRFLGLSSRLCPASLHPGPRLCPPKHADIKPHLGVMY